jgi:hypothetical protein
MINSFHLYFFFPINIDCLYKKDSKQLLQFKSWYFFLFYSNRVIHLGLGGPKSPRPVASSQNSARSISNEICSTYSFLHPLAEHFII